MSIQPENSLRFAFFESFANHPAAWHKICQDDLAMDARVLRVCQNTLSDQCRCWGVIVFDEAGEEIGCAALSLFHTETIQSSNPAVIRWRDRLRRIWPNFGKMGVLFCGLPIPAGSTHIRVREGACEKTVFAEVENAMKHLARRTRCGILIFKELEGAPPEVLSARGYVRGAVPPLHVLEAPFESLEHYLQALKSRYRAQVMRSLKKLETAGFEVISGRGPAFFMEHFDQRTHRLYVQMQRRAKHKLELMPLSFFRETAARLGNEAMLVLIRRGGEVCAFTFALMRNGVYYNTYSGLDYALNNEGDLYFNLFYHSMDQAFRAGATSLHLGQTSDAFKARLGTETKELWYYARLRAAPLNAGLRLFGPLFSPRVEKVERHDVFSKNFHPPKRRPVVKKTQPLPLPASVA